MTICLGCPTPAFAYVAYGFGAYPGYMNSLGKNIFCAGCAAVLTVFFIHPIDVVKTRIQLESNKGNKTGIGAVISGALDKEGAGAFYKGIEPAVLREASYSSLRMGLYEPIKLIVGANSPGASVLRKFLAGALAGAVGCTAGNPFDILKTKMMADKDPKGKGIAEYAGEIIKFQGFMGFYRGYTTNVMRAMVNNATSMACYDTIKTWMISMFALEGVLL